MEGVCRVCLSQDSNMYRVVNTTLEQTYDVLTSVKLQRADRPTALCCICVSQLRRCRRFIETAKESNDALDRWYRNHIWDLKLSEQPLLSFSKTKLFQISCDGVQVSGVKQEAIDTDNDGNDYDEGTYTEDIKYEVSVAYVSEKDNTQSDDEKQSTPTSKERDTQSNIKTEHRIINSVWVPLINSPEIEQTLIDVPTTTDTVSTTRSKRNIHSCSKCTYKASNKQYLWKHSKLHGEKQFACDKCDYKTNKKSDLQRHSKTHSDYKPFVCNKCEYKTNQKSNFKKHILKHGILSFKCEKCDYKTSQKRALQQHAITHSEHKPFTCDQCSFKTRSKISIKKHLMTHTGQKPFACDKCDYKSIQRISLKKHLMSHSGEKPFACDKCDYRSSYKSNLNHHLIKHNTEKLFSCDKCEFKSGYKASLKQHMRCHSGEKPFLCDKCDFRSSQEGHLKQHLLTHSSLKPFACNLCDFKCNRKNSLNRHFKNHK